MTEKPPPLSFRLSHREEDGSDCLTLVFANPASEDLLNPALKVSSEDLDLDIVDNGLPDIGKGKTIEYGLRFDTGSSGDMALIDLYLAFNDASGGLFCYTGYISLYKDKGEDLRSCHGLFFDAFATDHMRQLMREGSQLYVRKDGGAVCRFEARLQRSAELAMDKDGARTVYRIFARPFILLGRHAHNDLVTRLPQIEDKYPLHEKETCRIGRHHADIVFREGKFRLRDNKSSNGTYLDARRLAAGEEAVLGKKALIGLAGVIRLDFEVLAGADGSVVGAVIGWPDIEERRDEKTVILVSGCEPVAPGDAPAADVMATLSSTAFNYGSGRFRIQAGEDRCYCSKDKAVKVAMGEMGISLDELESDVCAFERKVSVPRISVTRKADKAICILGQAIEVCFSLTNHGASPSRLSYSEEVPEGAEVVSGYTEWRGELKPGQSVNLCYSLKPLQAGALTLRTPAVTTENKCIVDTPAEAQLKIKDPSSSPLLSIAFSVPRQLRRQKQDGIEVNVKNDGSSPALGIIFKLTGRIEDDPEETEKHFPILKPGEEIGFSMFVIPTVAGSNVRLNAYLQYFDKDGDHFVFENKSMRMEVIDAHEAVMQAAPVTYNISYDLAGAIVRGSQIGADFVRCPSCGQSTPKGDRCLQCKAPLKT